jgi:hypothetical protein
MKREPKVHYGRRHRGGRKAMCGAHVTGSYRFANKRGEATCKLCTQLDRGARRIRK